MLWRRSDAEVSVQLCKYMIQQILCMHVTDMCMHVDRKVCNTDKETNKCYGCLCVCQVIRHLAHLV